ncbi:restriction endonuclease subunit S [Prevotella communis]|uniref:restriction endonuclease subunit S n=1 Tax=Prevotella communis TaxID=2913614 RepID=UPI001EDBCF5D|nr:restriction endonuclease subunit S [Prevotella communis]UKK55421.1 restriction endonuclease subunit S [Prevotella communis]
MKEGWEYKKLGDLCQVLDSQRKPVTKKDRTKGIYPYYGATGIQDYVDSYIFDGRFLIVGEDGAKWGASDKTAYIIEGKSWVNNHAHILKVLENVNDRLLEYYLTFKDLSEYITGAVVPKLTQKALVSIPIPIPPLSEQQHIVEELDLLSSIIEKKKAQLKELDNLAQSFFYEMFGDPITNEKGWKVEKFKNVYKLKSGDGLSTKQFEEGPYPVYGGNGVSGFHKTYNMDGDYIIVGRVGVYCGNVRYVSGKFWLTDNAFQLFYDSYRQLPVFIKCMLTLLDLHQYANKAAQPVISNTTLKDIDILFPPVVLQQQFSSKIETIEHQKELIKQSIKEVETLFNSRMDYYFN